MKKIKLMVLGFFAAIMIIANLSLLTTDYFESDIDLSEVKGGF